MKKGLKKAKSDFSKVNNTRKKCLHHNLLMTVMVLEFLHARLEWIKKSPSDVCKIVKQN